MQQLLIQLANPLPFDLDDLRLAEYRNLDPRWQDWAMVKGLCADLGVLILDRIAGP